jgi:hypothetical protein
VIASCTFAVGDTVTTRTDITSPTGIGGRA